MGKMCLYLYYNSIPPPLSIFPIFFLIHFALQQSAELDELQKLCPSLRGVFCSHCSHKSVEEICPMECRFCVGFRTSGFGGQFQGAGTGAIGPTAPRDGIGGMLPQNLVTLKKQCAMVRGFNCYTCKIPSISELCVDECLVCENGGGTGGGGTGGTNIIGGGGGERAGNWLEQFSKEVISATGDNPNDPKNLLDIFGQLQKMELEEIERKNKIMIDDVGAEEEDEEVLLENFTGEDEERQQQQ